MNKAMTREEIKRQIIQLANEFSRGVICASPLSKGVYGSLQAVQYVRTAKSQCPQKEHVMTILGANGNGIEFVFGDTKRLLTEESKYFKEFMEKALSMKTYEITIFF